MRRYHLIVVVIVALLGAVVALAVTRSPVLGLDLQGGAAVVLEAKAPAGEEVTEEGLDQAVQTFRNRIDALGAAEPELRKQPPDQIAVEFPGVDDPERLVELLGSGGQLQFYDLEADLVPPSITEDRLSPVPSSELYPLLKELEDDPEVGLPTAWYAFDAEQALIAGPEPEEADLAESLETGELPADAEVLSVPGNRIVLSCGPPTDFCPGVLGPTQSYFYIFKYQPTDAEDPIPELTGQDLQLRGTRQDFSPLTGEPIVTLEFTGEGGDKFHDITRGLARRGEIRAAELGLQGLEREQAAQHFAIVLDNQIRSFPQIDFTDPTLSDGISGGSAQITGLSSLQEAEDLAFVLRSGALPYQFEVLDQSAVSATLGKDSLEEAIVAGIGGIVAVALFLLLVYRFLGVIALAGLAIYGGLLYGVILLVPVTLTLPGFAGLILTIGVAADANIVIFERIKEEVRLGKSVRAAITSGYRKGFGTIVDANVVTMITAFILFAVATAGVKGFALMLLIGTALSMFTAIAATRAMLGMLAGFRWFDNPAFMGASAQRIPMWQRIDFMGRRKVWFAISAVVVLAGVVSLGVQGLNRGIDFRGGSQVSLTTPEPVTVDRIREAAATVVPANAVIQGRGEAQGDRFTTFQIRTESLAQEEQNELERTLETEVGAQIEGVRNVSGSFSSQILRQAILAIVVSLLLIFVYIWVRFGLIYGLPVIAALVHDLVITLGIYSLVQRELTTPTVAAVLTILGYSIYDTIIIFDRVRENVPLMKRSSFAAIANQSIWETFRRSLATTFITLLPITSLFLFGGDTLKDFAFALMVGILSGGYSTIFIATPLLTILREREPEFAARKGVIAEEEKLLEPEPAAVVTGARRLARRLPRLAPAGAGDGGRGVEAEMPDEPEEELEEEVPAEAPAPAVADPDARRAARRQRRRTRPHGRAR